MARRPGPTCSTRTTKVSRARPPEPAGRERSFEATDAPVRSTDRRAHDEDTARHHCDDRKDAREADANSSLTSHQEMSSRTVDEVSPESSNDALIAAFRSRRVTLPGGG